ncbi:LptF/LptG family permease [Sulfurimonas sp. HSL3-2]|uniref:LptF/LptG family permease n=1 Tax=Hydrocurvibacter mobilis TaxID=3131936 RepID=UPI0031F9DFAF
MHKLRRYIINNFSILFLSIFLPLFAIASVIFMIKLATYTAVIQLTFFEMLKLYMFVLPEILFYTLPVTFFISATLTLFRLSNDNEMIVIFALGIKPEFLIRTLFKPALLLSLLLAFDFFILFPHATVLSSNFISYKKSEAKFNIKASEFGNNFGNWLLYVGKNNDDGTFGDVFLFNKEKDDEILINAKNAEVINQKGILKLKLHSGEGYSYTTDTLSQINYKTMIINDMMKADLHTYRKPLEYWLSEDRAESKRHMFITDSLLSLFPLISLFLVVAIGVVHVRHQKGYVYLYLFIAITLYYGATIGLIDVISFYTIPVVFFTSLLLSYYIYHKKILARF